GWLRDRPATERGGPDDEGLGGHGIRESEDPPPLHAARCGGREREVVPDRGHRGGGRGRRAWLLRVLRGATAMRATPARRADPPIGRRLNCRLDADETRKPDPDTNGTG